MGNLQRLGETVEFGGTLLGVLELQGWTLTRTLALGGGLFDEDELQLTIESDPGPEWIFELTHPRLCLSVKRQGKHLADVAVEMFKEAASFRPMAA